MAYANPKANLALGTYNVNPSSMRLARTALVKALSGGSNAHICCYGDSITDGTGATTKATTSWAARLRTLIDTKVGSTRGTGFMGVQNFAQFGGTVDATHLTFDGTLGSSWGGYNAIGFGPLGPGSSQGGAPSTGGIYFTVPNATPHTMSWTGTTDSLDIYYLISNGTLSTNNGGVFTPTIDGSAPSSGVTTINTVGTPARAKATCGPASQASHAFVLSGPASTGNPAVIGLEARQNGSTGGVRLTRMGTSGIKVAGYLNGSVGEKTYGCLACEFDMLAPDLSIILLETNDSNSTAQTALATYKSNLQTLITRARLTGDVLLMSTCPQGATIPTPITLSQYTQILYQLCDENNIGLLDIAGRWVDHTTSSALFFDSYHPNDAGHWDIAAATYNALASLGVGL